MRLASILLVALSITAATSETQAQSLHGQWFKVVASADGYGFNPETEATEMAKVKPITRYLFVVFEEGSSPSYSAQSYTPTTDGGWVSSYTSQFTMQSEEEVFIRDGELVLQREPIDVMEDPGAPNILVLEFNATVKTKFKGKQLKSSKIKSLGATAQFSNDAYFSVGRGKCTLTRIDASKLPFDAPSISEALAAMANAPVAPRPSSQAEQPATVTPSAQ